MHTCNPNTQEVEIERSEVQGHPRLHGEFKSSLGYIRPHPKILKKKNVSDGHHSLGHCAFWRAGCLPSLSPPWLPTVTVGGDPLRNDEGTDKPLSCLGGYKS